MRVRAGSGGTETLVANTRSKPFTPPRIIASQPQLTPHLTHAWPRRWWPQRQRGGPWLRYTVSLPGHLPARRPGLPDVRGPANSWSRPVTPISGTGKNSTQYLGRNYFQCVVPRFHSYYDATHAGDTGSFMMPDYNTPSPFVSRLRGARWVS